MGTPLQLNGILVSLLLPGETPAVYEPSHKGTTAGTMELAVSGR